MSDNDKKIDDLIQTSKEVLLGCCIGNGAIIAADTDHDFYPRNANNYRYVWPRDAAFILYALSLLGEDKYDGFADWLLQRAEGFHEKGLFFRRYNTNGLVGWPEDSFQPDQAGALLWSMASRQRRSSSVDSAVEVIANRLCSLWSGNHFTAPTHDLWEHVQFQSNDTSFTYSLAACAVGLELAAVLDLDGAERWQATAQEMKRIINQDKDHFTRLANEESGNIDSSLLGLAWPFSVSEDGRIVQSTIQRVKQELSNEHGVMRFQDDAYDGLGHRGAHQNKGAGAWPLLSFWYVIACVELDDRNQAESFFAGMLNQIENKYISEQIFEDERVGITPLGWSHAMFVIAANKLGYIS